MLGRFDYERPASVAEAARLLTEGGPSAAVLAGGTDLLVDLRGGRRDIRLLVDIKRIDVLRRLDVDRASGLAIGAAVALNEILEHAAVRRVFLGLAQAAESIATYQLRNRATAVGNLCNASPAADLAPILLALDASIVVQSARGERTVGIAQLFTGVKKTSLRPGEIATGITVPAPEPKLRSAFLKQQRLRGHDLALVNVAGTYAPASGLLRLAFGSCAPTPVLLAPIDAKGISREAVMDEAARVALAAASPISDVRASADYRRAVLPVLVKRLVATLLQEGGAP
ncbi:MAG: xanthine dehydrogenase family protein subunit M [Candidatus Bipolaricaulota bacterium]|nr:xanthine dehydrogenase family protein subunit M [Candidatus Bipolaricaulota bacterium]